MSIVKVEKEGGGLFQNQQTFELYTEDEGCAVERDAAVILMRNGKPCLRVRAYIDKAKGADGGWYNVIKFRDPELVEDV